jgi:YgiT-type zinc finger domain-containing protein
MSVPTTCPVCAIGRLERQRAQYIRLYGSTLVHAPQVPAWVCDQCGVTFFDPGAIQRVEMVIGESGPPPNQHRPAVRSHADDAPPPVPPCSPPER